MQFYVLKGAEIGSPERAQWGVEVHKAADTNRGDAPRCPACGHAIGMRTWLPPFRVELETWGTEFGDLAFLGVGNDLLVSHRFRQLWEREALRGISDFDPVGVMKVRRHRKLRDNRPLYFKARVEPTQAAIDEAASGSEWSEQPELCPVCHLDTKGVTFLRRRGTVIEPGTWTGEDLFIARAAADFIAAERFKQFCDANAITNAQFTPAEEHGHDFYPSFTTLLKKYLRVLEQPDWARGMRQEAYTTLLFMIDGNHNRLPDGDFDPDMDIDPAVVSEAKRRIGADSLEHL